MPQSEKASCCKYVTVRLGSLSAFALPLVRLHTAYFRASHANATLCFTTRRSDKPVCRAASVFIYDEEKLLTELPCFQT